MFDINFKLLAVRVLTSFLRKDKIKAWLFALVKPLESLHATFKTYADDTLFFLKHTGQKMSLERLLNLRYPAANGGIWIETLGLAVVTPYIYKLFESIIGYYVWKLSEAQPPTVYIYKLSEITLGGSNNFDFIVHVPAALVFDENQMRSIVSRYALAGMRFDIQTY